MMIEQMRILLEDFTKASDETAKNSEEPPPTVAIRSTHHQPSASFKVTVEEAEGEAITIASDDLLQSNFPVSFALTLVRRWVDQELRAVLASISDKSAQGKANEHDDSTVDAAAASLIAIDGDGETFIDAVELSKWTRKSIRTYCQSLISGETLKQLVEAPSSKAPYQWSANAVRNSRRKMEDRYIALPNVAWLYPDVPNADQTAGFGVYDGHGGHECADYTRAHLLRHVFHSSSYPTSVPQALQDGFLTADARMLKYCEREGRQSGTTAVCAIIKDGIAYVAWVGDSRALIVGRDGVQKITEPLHDTKNQEELDRVQAAGGLVFNFHGQDRVNGLLNITRSLGDLALKPTPLTGQPEVKTVPISPSATCLILASDGLFDGHDWDQVGDMVREYLKSHEANEYPDLAAHLVEAACNKTSDNVTVVVVFLKPMERLKEMIR